MHSVDECVQICSSLPVEAACLILQHTTYSVCIASYTFDCLGNMLSLYTEKKFLSFLCLEKERHELLCS